nr:putative ribonuclease H-like domain-containing protein [Tanacetum cinerariifolium]
MNFLGTKPALSFMRPFGCPVTIFNTIDHLGNFDGKADEGLFVGYSTNSKAFRVFNSRTRIVEENLHVKFSENTTNIAGSGPNWIFDIDALTKSINYKPFVTENQSIGSASIKACDNVGKTRVETVPDKDYILLPLWTQYLLFSSSLKDSPGAGFKPSVEEEKKDAEDLRNKDSEVPSTEEPRVNQEKDANFNSTNNINTVSPTDNAAGMEDNVVDDNIVYGCADDLNIHDLEEISRFSDAENDDLGGDMIEAIRLFLAYASFKDFVVYQMDVKSAFLYEKIEEEVYVCQPPGFEDPDFSDKVYKVEKVLYGLHQVPRAWYKTLSTYLLDNRKEMCTEFKKMMHKKFQMSSLGELTFFLGLQTASTPMETHKTLLKDEKGEYVDEHLYRSMIGSFMYLTSSRPDIIYLKGQPKLGLWYLKDSPFDLVAYTDSDYAGESLDRKFTTRGCQFLGCRLISWQFKKQIVVANSTLEAKDSNEKKLIQMIKIHTDKHVADLLTKAFDFKVNAVRRKLTTVGLVLMLLRTTAKAKNINGEAQIHAKVDGKKVIIFEASIMRDLRFEDKGGVDCFSNEVIFEQLTLIVYEKLTQKLTFWMDNHTRTYVIPSHTNKVFDNMRRVEKDFSSQITLLFPTRMVQAQEEIGEVSADPTDPHHTPTITQPSTSKHQKKQKPRKPRRQDTEETQPSGPTTNVEDEAFNKENVSQHSSDLLHSVEDKIKLTKLILCTNLQKRVFDLETIKTFQAQEITSLKKRVKRLEKKRKSRTHGLKRLYKVRLSARVESFADEESLGKEDTSKRRRISDIDANQDIYLDLQGEEVVVEKEVASKDVSVGEEVNAASIATSVTTTTTIAATTPTISMDEITLAKALIKIKTSRPKANGIDMQEPSEIPAPTPIVSSQQPSKVQDKGKGIMMEEPLKMKNKDQILFDEEVARKLQDENYEQERLAKVDTAYQLAERLHAEEQEQLTDAEKERLFMEFMKKRRKFFVAKRTIEKRIKPPTAAQQKSIMSTYLNNMDGWKPRALKNKSFVKIKELFNKAMQRKTALLTSELSWWRRVQRKTRQRQYKKAVQREQDELDQEKSKKQKVEDDKEKKDLKQCLEIIPDDGDEVTIDVIPLSVKTLITMFEHHVEDTIWKNQQGLTKVKNWKLFDSCGVHFDVGLVFEHGSSQWVEGYCDLDYAGDLDKQKSTTGYVFTLARALVSWKSTLQSTTALSTTKAAYMAMIEAVKEASWLQGLLGELEISQKFVTMHFDSQSAIHLAKNQVYHARTKHIDVRYHFIREILDEGEVRIQKIHTSKNPADMLTKVVAEIKFNYCLDLINDVKS